MRTSATSFPARVENLEAANAFVEACCDQSGLDDAKKFHALLVLEEAFVNICHYAYPNGMGDIDIACRIEDDAFVLEVADSGSPFDVLSLQDPDITLNIEDRPVGGLGILLIRTLSSPSYSRVDGKNILTMTLTIKSDETE